MDRRKLQNLLHLRRSVNSCLRTSLSLGSTSWQFSRSMASIPQRHTSLSPWSRGRTEVMLVDARWSSGTIQKCGLCAYLVEFLDPFQHLSVLLIGQMRVCTSSVPWVEWVVPAWKGGETNCQFLKTMTYLIMYKAGRGRVQLLPKHTWYMYSSWPQDMTILSKPQPAEYTPFSVLKRESW